MLFDQRVIFSDNGVLSDISSSVNDFRSGSAIIPYVAGQDYIYIGTFLPFNHRYFDISSVNSVASGVRVEIWDGKTFNSAVDVLDQTRSSTVPLAQDGYIRWSRDRNQVWNRELDSSSVTGLGNTYIYNFFWLRLSWTTSLSVSTAISFIGHKFSKDAELFSYYPDLNNTSLMEAFATGKTDWEEQHYIAAEQIIRELKRKSAIISADQLLDYELFIEPSVHKVAELVYSGLGSTYEDKRKSAEVKYINTLDAGYLRVDLDGDSNLSASERVSKTGFLTR